MAKVGTITIGQSPREDITADLEILLPPRTQIFECGALDDLSRSEIDRLAPSSRDYPLVTRLRDRATVVIGKERLVPLIANAIRKLQAPCDVILILCSGPFPDFQSRVPVLYPSRILEHFVRGLAPRSATVLIPHEGQIEPAREHWGSFIDDVTPVVASPYPWACPGRLGSFVIMDCLGYSLAMKKEVRERTGGSVVLVRSVAAAALQELLG